MVHRPFQTNDLGGHNNLLVRGGQQGRQLSHGPRTHRLIAAGRQKCTHCSWRNGGHCWSEREREREHKAWNLGRWNG